MLRLRSSAWLSWCFLYCACHVYDDTRLGTASAATTTTASPMSGAGRDAHEGESGAGGTSSAGSAGALATSPVDIKTCADGGDCWWWKDVQGCRSDAVPPATFADTLHPDDVSSAGAVSLDDMYFGWTEVRMSSAVDGADAASMPQVAFGLDLDGVCTNSNTCQDHGEVSCRSRAKQQPYDGDDCRDNAFANLLAVAGMIPPLGETFGLSESKLNCGLKRGSFNMLMRVRDYNGRSDDPQVRVDWYASPGLQKVPSWTCNDGSDWKKALPWRVSASWRVSQDDLTSDGMLAGGWPDSKYADAKAYVKGGYLISHLPDAAALRLAGDGKPFRGLHLPLHGAVWMAHLKQTQDTTWIIDDGLVAGRAREDDVERSLNEVGFCSGVGFDMFYESLILYARENADVLASGANDPEAMCDALSLGLSFQAAQITPGPAGSVEPIVTCCAPDMPTAECVADCGDGKVTGNERCDTAIAEGASGACPTHCVNSDPCQRGTLQGDGCYARCTFEEETTALSGDHCCPKGATPALDDDCKSSAACGNGILEAGETCDPQSSCASCATYACLNVETTGAASSCNLSCKYSPLSACQAGDGCCPEGCDHAHDADCSDQCGNGTIDPGETCEPDVAGKACPTSCDDNNPCTLDIPIGNAATCNRACSHAKIAQAIDGDGCCPSGINANANSDSDCTPMCGNGVIEPGEECDDGNKIDTDACTSSCKMVDPVEECLKRVNLRDDCSKCVCSKCQAAANSCYANSDKKLSDACVKLARCFRVSHCTGFDCYCAQDWLNCENNPSGPCKAEIETAAGSESLPAIVARLQDNTTALGLANVVGSCGWDSCAGECGN